MNNINFYKYIKIITSDNTPIQIKNRTIFFLRNLESDEAADALSRCICKKSVLLDHEIAYVLGQMRRRCSIPFLFQLAGDPSHSPIVRHEAIEALGNYQDKNLINDLQVFLKSETDLVRESAILAIDKLKLTGEGNVSKYGSHDPAYPYASNDINILKDMFMEGTLTEKYQALFKLRDINTKESIMVLAEGFKDPSALLRHEVAYVFGQMENPDAIFILEKVLKDEAEEEVVRHEAAEALGAIGTDRCKDILKEYKNTKIQIIRESIEVGIEIAEKDIEEYLTIE